MTLVAYESAEGFSDALSTLLAPPEASHLEVEARGEYEATACAGAQREEQEHVGGSLAPCRAALGAPRGLAACRHEVPALSAAEPHLVPVLHSSTVAPLASGREVW